MADIELVIKIPEEVYDFIKRTGYHTQSLYESIKDGTPLSKGHGRLKDVDAIMRELSVVSSRPIKSQLYILREAPTIIEADKAESEEV